MLRVRGLRGGGAEGNIIEVLNFKTNNAKLTALLRLMVTPPFSILLIIAKLFSFSAWTLPTTGSNT